MARHGQRGQGPTGPGRRPLPRRLGIVGATDRARALRSTGAFGFVQLCPAGAGQGQQLVEHMPCAQGIPGHTRQRLGPNLFRQLPARALACRAMEDSGVRSSLRHLVGQ